MFYEREGEVNKTDILFLSNKKLSICLKMHEYLLQYILLERFYFYTARWTSGILKFVNKICEKFEKYFEVLSFDVIGFHIIHISGN